jgi:hypothetical protein
MIRQTLTWLLLLAGLAWAAPLCADGCFIPPTLHGQAKPSSAAQKAILIPEGEDEVLLLQTTYQGPADRFAWVIPVPAEPTETFAAEPGFLTETFRGTEPVVVTELGKPRRSRFKTLGVPTAAAPPPPGAAGGMAAPPPVQVLQEQEVGDYHAVVLAATRGDELQKWLEKNGYHLPADAQPVLSGYVQRGWVFVALKMQQQRAREQGVLTEVAPLGLRFRRPAEGLVYPLTISRVSAPPFSAILLCVIAAEPYTCTTLPTVWLTEQVKLKRDQTYGDLRRRMTRNPTRLLCEFSGGAPFHYLGLGYRANDWETREGGDFHTRQASRFFGLLAPEEMVDLTFAPDTDPRHADYRMLVRRKGPAIPPMTMAELTHAALLTPGSLEQQRALDEPLTPPPWKPTKRPLGDDWRVPVAVIIAFLAGLWWFTRPPRRAMPPAALFIVLTLGLIASLAQSGGMGPGLSVLNMIQAAVDMFQEDTGCLPATVADLAVRQQPAMGLDASGNQVPVHGWRGPYLRYLPPDPIRRGHLVMDPLNAFALDTTGLDTTCEPATYEEARQAAGKHGHELQAYWKKTPAQVAREMEPYSQWLQGRQGHRLFAFETGVNSLGADAVTALVVDRDDLSYFAIKGKPCRVGVNGQVLTWHAAREEQEAHGMMPSVELFCGTTDVRRAFALLPRPPTNAKVLALGPDGAALVTDDEKLSLLGPDGGRRDYEWEGEGIWAAALSRDGKMAYVISRVDWSGATVMISRMELASGQVMADRCVRRESCAVGSDGVFYPKDNVALCYLGEGQPRLLVRDLPGFPLAVALSREYAYWAMSGDGDEEENTIYRVSLHTGRIKAIARFSHRDIILAADGTDLYTARRDDDGTDRLTLLANGRKPLRLVTDPQLVAPENLPRVDP